MKTIKIIKGFLLLLYHLLAPIAFWGIIATSIWGPEVLNTPRKGEPDMIFFLVFVPPAMLISAWHYVFNDFVPNVLVLMPKGKKADPQSIEMMRSWIRWCNNSSVISNYPIGDTPGGPFNLPDERSG
jgi:hypothetical protein